MKYIITENKLEKLMLRYLENYVSKHHVGRWDSFIVITHKFYDDLDESEHYIFEHDKFDDRLYINITFFSSFMNIFPVSEEEAKDFLKNWFEKKFKVNVNKIDIGT